ncbi:MAG TPA: hypothetical protein VGC25_01630 [Alphaproteobacteria bacterium]|jgi:tripartite-type tricarboxylate transporter receptor subunit TctC
MMASKYLAGGLCLGALALVATASPVAADAVADFYKGKRIQMLIGYSPGGGYDRYARTISRYWGKHIPGNPTFVSRNLPGAGSMRLMNEVYNTRPKDGTVVATVGRGMVQEQLFGGKGVKFDASKVSWIGSANNEVSTCVVWHTVPVESLQDFLNTEIVVGGTGPGADTDTFPMILNNLAGAKLKLVTGYPGGNDINFGIERGELQGRCGWSWSSVVSTRASWLKEKKIKVMLQLALDKHPDLPDVPLVMDLAKDDRARQILTLIFGRQTMGRPYLTTPGVPADRLKALRAGFSAVFKDPEFQTMAKKTRLEINPVSGEAVQRIVTAMFKSPKDIVEAARVASTSQERTQVSKAVVPVVTVSGKITGVQREGRRIIWAGDVKKGRVNVGGSTEITVAGQKVKRSALKVGMTCDFKVKGVEAALAIACK